MAEIEEVTAFDVLYKDVHVAVAERDRKLKEFSARMSRMLSVMDKMQKDSMIEAIHNNLKGVGGDSTLNQVKETEKKIEKLEDRERKLVAELNKVMSNLYLLPGYVLAVSTGVSGLLSSDPRICGLFVFVILVVITFLGALGLSVHFARRQLRAPLLKKRTFASERRELYSSFKDDSGKIIGIDATAATENLTSFERVNEELEFQAAYYRWFLLLITFCGVLYAIMLLVAGFCILCDCKAISFDTLLEEWLWLLTYLKANKHATADK